MNDSLEKIDSNRLIETLTDARAFTLAMVEDLSDEEMLGPRLSIVNPPIWELGHIAWFQECWILRHLHGRTPIDQRFDRLYNSAKVAHDKRWSLRFPKREDTMRYMQTVLEAVCDLLSRGNGPDPRDAYFHLLASFHEDMHGEAFAYTRQTHGYGAPSFPNSASNGHSKGTARIGRAGRSARQRAGAAGAAGAPGAANAAAASGDVAFSAGTYYVGAPSSAASFIFDNEKWAHPVTLREFAISRTAVTNGEFLAFVEAGGYTARRFWSDAGWRWRAGVAAEHPVYWRREPGGNWLRRRFEQWVPLERDLPVMHVNWHEAEAYGRWAGRRLPDEAEWEVAASAAVPGGPGDRRSFPWGEASPNGILAALDGRSGDCVDVTAHPKGASPQGVQQMIGNVWEWTATDFHPYPGFVADPYKEYSEPWFGDHKVLRGGCWVTRSRLIRNTWRNFYTPERRDVWAGFRTCARDK
ncbi:MAG: SUMF1/EgtB/PvdO family nonheme iron enzyme [Planctomycetes bacterium]|nr:SUMF1/EgtB/PvdO family nonheme iron enzyme [Planctomycetota bacterium]